MATGEQAISALAGQTGIDHAHVQRVARVLREAGGDLWPQSGRGGGRAARHVQPQHLAALLIALAVAEPITKGPSRVQAFRMVVKESGDFPGETFGDALYGLIDRLSQRPGRWLAGVALVLFPGMIPKAIINHPSDGQGTYTVADVDAIKIASLMRISVIGIDHIVQISAAVIQAAADLWADSRAAQAALESKSGASPGRETPQSTRPTDETSHTDDRRLDSDDSNPCVCVSTTPEGGSPPPGAHHHDDRDHGDAGHLAPGHRAVRTPA